MLIVKPTYVSYFLPEVGSSTLEGTKRSIIRCVTELGWVTATGLYSRPWILLNITAPLWSASTSWINNFQREPVENKWNIVIETFRSFKRATVCSMMSGKQQSIIMPQMPKCWRDCLSSSDLGRFHNYSNLGQLNTKMPRVCSVPLMVTGLGIRFDASQHLMGKGTCRWSAHNSGN